MTYLEGSKASNVGTCVGDRRSLALHPTAEANFRPRCTGLKGPAIAVERSVVIASGFALGVTGVCQR